MPTEEETRFLVQQAISEAAEDAMGALQATTDSVVRAVNDGLIKPTGTAVVKLIDAKSAEQALYFPPKDPIEDNPTRKKVQTIRHVATVTSGSLAGATVGALAAGPVGVLVGAVSGGSVAGAITTNVAETPMLDRFADTVEGVRECRAKHASVLVDQKAHRLAVAPVPLLDA